MHFILVLKAASRNSLSLQREKDKKEKRNWKTYLRSLALFLTELYYINKAATTTSLETVFPILAAILPTYFLFFSFHSSGWIYASPTLVKSQKNPGRARAEIQSLCY